MAFWGLGVRLGHVRGRGIGGGQVCAPCGVRARRARHAHAAAAHDGGSVIGDLTYGGRDTYGDTHMEDWRANEWKRLQAMGAARAGNGLLLTRGTWDFSTLTQKQYVLTGVLEFWNTTNRSELFVTECDATARVLGSAPLGGASARVDVLPMHADDDDYGVDAMERNDGYWVAYILKAGGMTRVRVTVTVDAGAEDGAPNLPDVLESCAVRIRYVSYGPKGRRECSQHVVLPLRGATNAGANYDGSTVIPVKTHLLCHLDEPVSTLVAYAKPFVSSPEDVVTIGESPLALMQGRYRHPETVVPGLVARASCRLFQPTSSLATACGMQSLVDAVGARRVAFATLGGIASRLVMVRGGFYRLAGRQARLVDDVTGTLAPYDQFICLGPTDVDDFVRLASEQLGCGVAVVDVNDLSHQKGTIHILASSQGVSSLDVNERLLSNPAGNGAQQTPIVVLRK